MFSSFARSAKARPARLLLPIAAMAVPIAVFCMKLRRDIPFDISTLPVCFAARFETRLAHPCPMAAKALGAVAPLAADFHDGHALEASGSWLSRLDRSRPNIDRHGRVPQPNDRLLAKFQASRDQFCTRFRQSRLEPA